MRMYFFISALLVSSTSFAQNDTWMDAKQNGQGTIDIYWFSSNPFVFHNTSGELVGVEYELIATFAEYVKVRDGIDLTINWKKTANFRSIIETIQSADKPNAFGASAFSITEDRKQKMLFTNSYLPDVTVLVTSKGTRIVNSIDEMSELIGNKVAVTVRGTNYERLLVDLKQQTQTQFEVMYLTNDQKILDHILKDANRFGYIDLPVYLMLIGQGADLTRQNLFTNRGEGYGIMLPKESDWVVPFNDFLDDPIYRSKISKIIAKYFGEELSEFMDNLYAGGQINTSLLTKEKEIQLELIRNAGLQLKKEKGYKRMLAIGICVSLVFVVVIGLLWIFNRRATRLLIAQTRQIDSQREDIKEKNEQLINRNTQLVALNEEKNHLVRILAHDLRSPVSQIIMLADMLNHVEGKLAAEDKVMLAKIGVVASRTNQMISKILDMEALDHQDSKVLFENVQIREVMSDLMDRYEPVAKQKDVKLLLNVDPFLEVIETDHLMLIQILENLISNAIKFSETQTTVGIEVAKETTNVLFKIVDQGPGISKKDQKKLFLRFQKLSAKPTGGEDSIGLGLSIVKKFVTELDGNVWVESEVGKGSTFFVSLPAELKLELN